MCETMLNIKLSEPHLSNVLNGLKTIEGRSGDHGLAKLNCGDKFTVTSNEDPTSVLGVMIIVRKQWYSTFRDMLATEGIDKTLPNVSSVDEGVKVYHAIKDYPQREQDHGVVAVEFVIVKV